MIKGGEATGLSELVGSSIKAASLRTMGRLGSEVLALDSSVIVILAKKSSKKCDF